MITDEEIKKFEKLQELEKRRKDLEKDYSNISKRSICLSSYFSGDIPLNIDYRKYLKVIIKNKIRKIDKQIKRLKEE